MTTHGRHTCHPFMIEGTCRGLSARVVFDLNYQDLRTEAGIPLPVGVAPWALDGDPSTPHIPAFTVVMLRGLWGRGGGARRDAFSVLGGYAVWTYRVVVADNFGAVRVLRAPGGGASPPIACAHRGWGNRRNAP